MANLGVLVSDDTRGVSRDFNILVSLLSTIYVSMTSVNTIYGNGKPSSMLLMAGPLHQYSYWLLFCYYGSDEVLTDHSIGYMNWLYTIVVGLFTVDMVIKTWTIAVSPETYSQYLKENSDN